MKFKRMSFFFFLIGSIFLFDSVKSLFTNFHEQRLMKQLQGVPCVVTEHLPQQTSNQYACPRVTVKYDNTSFPVQSQVQLACVNNQEQLNLLQHYPLGKSLTCWYNNKYYSTLHEPRPGSIQQKTRLEKILVILGLIFICIGLIILFFEKKPPNKVEAPKTSITQLTPKKTFLVNILFIVMGIICLLFSLHLLQQEWYAMYQFQETRCTVVDKKILEKYSSKNKLYAISLNLRFTAQQKTYQVWHSPTLFPSYDNITSKEQKLNHYTNGKIYPCWFDPKDSNIVILERGSFLMSLIALVISLLLILSGLPSILGLIKKWIRKSKNE